MLVDYDDLRSTLRENVVEVIFTKLDGTNRRMKATLKRSFLPAHLTNEEYKRAAVESTGDKETLTVWDLGKKDWRSFRIDRVLSTQVLDVL